jgi:hypothetical protein
MHSHELATVPPSSLPAEGTAPVPQSSSLRPNSEHAACGTAGGGIPQVPVTSPGAAKMHQPDAQGTSVAPK